MNCIYCFTGMDTVTYNDRRAYECPHCGAMTMPPANHDIPDKVPTFNEFLSTILYVMPYACVEEDNYGQMVIYTDLMEDKDGNVVAFEMDKENK